MSPRQKVAKALLEATDPNTCAPLATAASIEARVCSRVLRSLVEEGAAKITMQGRTGVPSLYAADDRMALQAIVDGATTVKDRAAAEPQRRKSSKAAKRNKARRPLEDRKDAISEPKQQKQRTKKRATKRKARAAPTAVTTLCYFLDEERDVQIMRADGEGEVAIVPRADAVRLAAFLQNIAQVLEPA